MRGEKQGKRLRFVIMGVIWLAAFFLILDRVNISLAAPRIMAELGLSGVQMGFVLSIFFWGYMFGNLGGGVASDTLNIRRFTSVMLLLWCVMTAMTGLCRTISHFALVRGVFGLTEGASVGPFHKLQNNWLLPEERGRYWGLYLGFAYLGVAFGLPLVGWLIRQWDWQVMFFLLGAATLLLVAIFSLMITDHPHQHPWISPEEKELISEALRKDRVTFDSHDRSGQKLPFKEGFKMLTGYWPFWALCVCNFATGAIYFANMTWLPSYLVKERHFAILESGFYLTIPYLAAFGGAVGGGALADRLGHRGLLGFFFCLFILPAMLGVMSSSNILWIIVLMSIALFCNSAALNSILVLLFDLLPSEVFGTAVGILVGIFGGLAGVTSPILIGYFYDLTGSFFWGFSSVAMGSLVGAVLFLPIGSHERRVKREKAARLALAIPKDGGEKLAAGVSDKMGDQGV